MKFVCERCHTKYSITDEKVRGKVLKVRCKACANVITVRETGATVDDADGAQVRDFSASQRVGGSGPASRTATSLPEPAVSGSRKPPVGPPRRPTPRRGPPAPPAADTTEWHLAVEGAQTGPFTRAKLCEKILALPGGADVHVWNESFDGWKPPGEVPELGSELGRRRRPPTPPARRRLSEPPPMAAARPPVAPVAAVPSPVGSRAVVPDAAAPALAGSAAPAMQAPVLAGSAAPAEAKVTAAAMGTTSAAGAAAARDARVLEPPPAAGDVPLSPAEAPPLATPKRNGFPAGNGAGRLAGFGLGDLLGADGLSGPAPAPAAVAVVSAAPAPAPEPAPAATGETAGAGVSAPAGPAVAPASVRAPAPAAARAPAVTPAAARAPAPAAAASKNRQVKLLMAGSVLVVVVCGVVSARVSRKPAPPVAAAEPVPARVAPTDFASLARSLAKEEGQARALSPPPEEKPVETKPVEAPPAPPEVKAVSISSSTPRDKGGGRRSRRKSPSPSTVPPPLGTPSVPTADERDAANRFGEVNGREARLATSTGSIARSTPAQGDISHVITNNRQGIQTCYQRALLRDTSLTHGKVTVRVSIGLSGKVKSVSLDAPAQFRALEPCIRDVMSRWAFPPSSEEYGTEFPVVLQGNQ